MNFLQYQEDMFFFFINQIYFIKASFFNGMLTLAKDLARDVPLMLYQSIWLTLVGLRAAHAEESESILCTLL